MKPRILFLAVVLGLLSLSYSYLALSLGSSMPERLAIALPFVFVFFLFHLRRSAHGSWPTWLMAQLSYLNMGLVSFLLVGALARDLAGIFLGAWAPKAAVIVFAVLALIAASARGFFGPWVRTLRLPYEDLPRELDGLRIVQISDLHIGASIGKSYVDRVVRKTLQAKPDLVAFTGDIGDGPLPDFQKELDSLAPLTKNSPVYFVPGNHEAYWDPEKWLAGFRGLGMKVLMNEGELASVKFSSLYVGGIPDPAFAQMAAGPAQDLEKAMAGANAAPFKLLLSHRPDPADQAAKLGFDLQLSGHTHGGQFFPWTLVVKLVHRYSLGAYRIGKMWLYVSPGTGSWGPRLRLGTTPEITLIILESARA